jgi:MoaA/NifB/PqqE/SkfB family radical SAM enzyme
MRKKETYLPEKIYIEVTNFCDADCICCPHGRMRRPRGYMSWELFKKIIDECRFFYINTLKTIYLHKDGEPLLDPLLFERIKYIKSYLPNARIQINSNANALGEDKALQLLNSRIDGIVFSVNGASKNTFEKITSGVNYDTIKHNLDIFFKIKKNIPNQTHVTMQMLISRDNKHEIDEYQRLWLGKPDRIYFKPMHNFLDMKTSIKTLKLNRKQVKFCTDPFKIQVIYWNGNVGLCCWDYDNFVQLGNVREDTLYNVYNNENFETVRRAMCKKGYSRINPCNRCSVIYGEDRNSRNCQWSVASAIFCLEHYYRK